ncbi:cysteine-rich KTR domain-containing protein [Streptococcus pseudopneumoniae]
MNYKWILCPVCGNKTRLILNYFQKATLSIVC